MRDPQCCKDFSFGDLVKCTFDGTNRISGPGDDDVHVALVELRHCRVDDELAVDPSDADSCNRRGKRYVRKTQGRGGAEHAQDVGVIFTV